MTFPYQMVLVQSCITGQPDAILRPEIPVRLCGPRHEEIVQGLLDTGSDRTILPGSVADCLGLSRKPSQAAPSTAFGGQQLTGEIAEVECVLEDQSDSYRWSTIVDVIDLPEGAGETVILGFTGFLEFFRCSFDPEGGLIELEPNSFHPANTRPN